MAQSTITWNPAPGTNSLSQSVQYKLASSPTWLTFSTETPGIASKTITGLIANTIYDFKIVDNCAVGGAVSSATDTKILFSCPIVTITPTFNSVGFSFDNLYANIAKYVVQLLTADGNSVLGTISITNITPATFSDSFTGLTDNTTYKLRVTLYAGTDLQFNGLCSATSFTTGAAPICGVPGAVVAIMSL